jgi:uncharacterized protein
VHSLQELAIQVPRADIATSQVAYQLGSDFFSLFQGSLLEKGDFIVNVCLDKTPRHVQLRFLIQGEVELSCDRTGELFNYPLHIERAVQFKLGEEYQELGLDMYMIERGASHIEVAQHIYDFVNIAIPMKRLHPRFGED